jgi:hypothetical protein
VERLIERPGVAERLDALTALDADEAEAIRHVLEPVDGFEDRVSTRVRRQLDSEIMSLIFDLGGLGWYTAASLLDPEDDHTEE